MHSHHVHLGSLATTLRRKHRISTEELEAKLGIHDIRHWHYAHSRVLGYLGHVFRMDAGQVRSGILLGQNLRP